MLTRLMLAAAFAVSSTIVVDAAKASPVDVDITFVIDQSGSMGGEFSFLGSAIGGFLAALEGSELVGTARAALVSYHSTVTLHSDLTSDPSALETSFGGVPIIGGTENAYTAVRDAAFNLGIGYGANRVKSLILITDEDADDSISGSGSDELRNDLLAAGFLNNVIYDPDNEATSDLEPIAISSLSSINAGDALFDINAFRDDQAGFFAAFTAAKLSEIEDVIGGGEVGGAVVPVPAALPLLLSGLAGIVVLRRGRSRA
jgi:hypothetical protein